MTEYTDPPNMPDGERMTDAEFRVIRDWLGLTGDWLAGHLGVSDRTVRHWEQGKFSIPDGVWEEVERLEADTALTVANAVGQLMDMPEPGIITYRTDAEFRAAHPEVSFPASWHRQVVARIAQEVPGLSIAYAPQGKE
ncbi:DUF1870 family protein [Streptomyces sp. NPDC048209]|uniref:helix-turn-helix domain-containing protein n=1 Tax=Streptomyces sp. NPDC048209 TaxID=3156689 RepID=UPI0034463877